MQAEKSSYLLRRLIEESTQFQDISIPQDEYERQRLIRSLMNIRMPKPISNDLFTKQDEYLQELLKEKGIVEWLEIPTVKEAYGSTMPFADKISIWQGDITRLKVGAIVNAANARLLGCFVPCHGCIDNAIHTAAGMQLRMECHEIMNKRRKQFGNDYEEPVGTATLTKAYNLPCDYVIHTVGPIVYNRVTDNLRRDLQNCYKNVLKCCVKHKIHTVAFCCISTGEFHFPNDEAAEIARKTTVDFLQTESGAGMERVIFNVFKDEDKEIYESKISR